MIRLLLHDTNDSCECNEVSAECKSKGDSKHQTIMINESKCMDEPDTRESSWQNITRIIWVALARLVNL